MKKLDLDDLPERFIVWKLPPNRLSGRVALTVPPGLEAVLVGSKGISPPYRSGDQLVTGGRKSLFFRTGEPAESVYLCNKNGMRPLLWGMGDLPYEKKNGEKGFFGANGQIILLMTNARAFVSSIALEGGTLDNKALEERMETVMAGLVKPALIDAVTLHGFEEASLRLKALSDEAARALDPQLFEIGLGVKSFVVEELFRADVG